MSGRAGAEGHRCHSWPSPSQDLRGPSNIAEGHSRHSTPHYIQHLWTAHASGAELETQVEVGRRVELFTDHQAEILIRDAQEVGRMINGLVRSLERSEQTRSR